MLLDVCIHVHGGNFNEENWRLMERVFKAKLDLFFVFAMVLVTNHAITTVCCCEEISFFIPLVHVCLILDSCIHDLSGCCCCCC